jgi:hypothetical protein
MLADQQKQMMAHFQVPYLGIIGFWLFGKDIQKIIG